MNKRDGPKLVCSLGMELSQCFPTTMTATSPVSTALFSQGRQKYHRREGATLKCDRRGPQSYKAGWLLPRSSCCSRERTVDWNLMSWRESRAHRRLEKLYFHALLQVNGRSAHSALLTQAGVLVNTLSYCPAELAFAQTILLRITYPMLS